ncbi:MAG TPA: DUF4142 domain-containing protein [Ohtaekwangia sp.]|uniref:DUF4142 domain-containing protein n=1 Tax=Ohtaekwangia sp. TaxID=2066019 RepID=UPI002F95CD43
MAYRFSLVTPYLIGITLLVLSSCTCETEESAYELNEADRGFMTNLYGYNEYKLQAASLAIENGKTATQTLASDIEQDLELTRNRLKTIAANTHYTLPDAIPADAATQLSALIATSPETFDIHYVQSQLTQVAADIALLEKELEEGTEPSVMALTQEYLPVLQLHKAWLEELLDTL